MSPVVAVVVLGIQPVHAQLRKPYDRVNIATSGHLTSRDHRTVKKLKTVRLCLCEFPNRIVSCQRNGWSLFFLFLWKEGGVHGEKNHNRLARNRKKPTRHWPAVTNQLSPVQTYKPLGGWRGTLHHQIDCNFNRSLGIMRHSTKKPS